MQIEIRYFAIVKERLRLDHEVLEVDDGSTVADAMAKLAALHPAIAELRPHLAVARNLEFVTGDALLSEGDEIALIPPVAGGSDTRVRIVDRPIALSEVTELVATVNAGAIVTFTGTVRKESRGQKVDRLEYEAYVPMAERALAHIGREVEATWPGARVAITHRIGVLLPGDISVVIATATPHRADAFSACREIIERLKKDVPIWKKEWAPDGTAIWVGMGS